MARYITLTILVNEDDDAAVLDGINEMLRKASTPVDDEAADEPAWIIDWTMGACEPASYELSAKVADGTYEEGDMASD